MEKITFIVERLNQRPFNKGITTLSEFDSKTPFELMEIICDVIVSIDPEQEPIRRESTENKIQRLMHFLTVMKFGIPEDQIESFHNFLLSGDKETLHTVIHWCLFRYDHLKKRAYLAKYLMPVEISAEYFGDELINELSNTLKDLQAEFKEVHKVADQNKGSGMKPSEIKAEIAQLEQERTQLNNKIQKLKKECGDEKYFREILKVTSELRKEQEEEARIHDRIREHRQALHEAEARHSAAAKRLAETRTQGIQNASAEELLARLQREVREINSEHDAMQNMLNDKLNHLEKLKGWENSDRVTTEDDVRAKRSQLRDMESEVATLQERLDAALERNNNLSVFRQAANIAFTKLRDKEGEYERLVEEKRSLQRQIEAKEAELDAQAKQSGAKIGKRDLKKFGAQVKEKIETYKRMRDEISQLRNELVVLQRTEQILRGRDKNLEDFLLNLEKKMGIEGYRDTQKSIIEMSERTAEVDQMKGATLEQISAMVEEIGREFKSKQMQLQPRMAELKALRQEYMEVETQHDEVKAKFEKVAVGLEIEKQSLEKECEAFQEECLREESRYHTLNSLVSMTRIKLQRAQQEKQWQEGQGRMLRDFACFRDLYENKIAQQEQLTKQLRKQQKELKENATVMSNQKTNFKNLQLLLEAKVKSAQGEYGHSSAPVFAESMAYLGGSNVMSM